MSAPTACVRPAWAWTNGVKVPRRRTTDIVYMATTTSSRQGQPCERLSEGSRRQRCEPRNTNAIEGRYPWGESAQHDKALWFRGHGKWCGCAARVHVLIRGDLLDQRSEAATGAGLRPSPKGLDEPPDPTAALAARPGAIRDVIGQKSAEAIVGAHAKQGNALKGRTRWDKEEP
jgi:hypothetical protein